MRFPACFVLSTLLLTTVGACTRPAPARDRTAPATATTSRLIQRAIPSSGELIPAVGLNFANHPSCADTTGLKVVMKTFADNGGRVIDAMQASDAVSERFHYTAANELGIQNKVFWSVAGGAGANAGPGQVKARIDSLLKWNRVPRIDLAMLGANSTANNPQNLRVLQEEKKAGRVRYIGVQAISTNAQAAQIEAVMRNEPIDFIGVGYDIGNRKAEETILPLAMERKIGVIVYFPFGNNGGASCASGRNLFARVANTPVPEWAADFDATTWAQFFLKYVLSHPAVTVARVSTTKPHHVLDNLGGGVGRLPDEATRKRMAAFIDALPPIAPPGIALSAAILDRYVGEWTTASGAVVTFRRDGAKLLVTAGRMTNAPLTARSETRLHDPQGTVFEFQVDGQGTVTGLVLEQGNPPQRIPLTRK